MKRRRDEEKKRRKEKETKETKEANWETERRGKRE